MMREAELNRQNSQTAAMNTRLMQVLEDSTGTVLPPTPADWWQWWNDENEVFAQTGKQVRQRYQRERIAIVDRPTFPQTTGPGDETARETGGPQLAMTQMPGAYDCLAAGTKVWTDLGPLAIEEIQVGDRVLLIP